MTWSRAHSTNVLPSTWSHPPVAAPAGQDQQSRIWIARRRGLVDARGPQMDHHKLLQRAMWEWFWSPIYGHFFLMSYYIEEVCVSIFCVLILECISLQCRARHVDRSNSRGSGSKPQEQLEYSWISLVIWPTYPYISIHIHTYPYISIRIQYLEG